MTGDANIERDDEKVPDPNRRKDARRPGPVKYHKKRNWSNHLTNADSFRAFRRLLRRKRRRQHLIIMAWMLLFSMTLLVILIYLR